jgi:hypothetical protein
MTMVMVGLPAMMVGCPSSDSGSGPDVPSGVCAANDECQAGEICSAGVCTPGSCDPSLELSCGPTPEGQERNAYCCKTWQNCNVVTLQCERDPAAVGIGCPPTEPDCRACEDNEDCGLGSFCSSGRCFEFDGRTTCQDSFQCAGGQRCDRTEFVCVPDNGGCNFCSEDFRELCCEEGTELCNNESGQCSSITDEMECTVETQADDCRPLEFCNSVGQCVQCDSDDDCGLETLRCNVATGTCFSPAGSCDSNDDCPNQQVCAISSGQCVFAECRDDGDCTSNFQYDQRYRCDIDSYACFLPPATCTEADEPNDSTNEALETTLLTGYSGVLCRGDADVISFPVQALKAYSVTVTVSDPVSEFFFGNSNEALSVELLDASGGVASGASIFEENSPVRVRAATGENVADGARFYVRFVSSTAVDYDRWRYSVVIQEADYNADADCTAQGQMGQEPNNDFAGATPLQLGTPFAGTRCGVTDADFFRVDVPLQTGLNVVVDDFSSAIGNLQVEVFDAPSNGDRVASSNVSTEREEANAPEGPTTFYIKVSLADTDALQNQTYQITLTAKPRSEDCVNDLGENDDALANAQIVPALVVGTPYTLDDVIRCNNQDVDHFSFTMPANAAGNVGIRFNQAEGNLRLALLSNTGTSIESSDTSTAANGSEAVVVPVQTMDVTYVVRVQGPTTGGLSAQRYDLAIGTYDAAVCLANEPEDDGTVGAARCVGAADHPSCDEATRWALLPDDGVDLAACVAATGVPQPANCGRMCGNEDKDYYRLGLLELGQSVESEVVFDPAQGQLNARLFSLNNNSPSPVGAFVGDEDDGVADGVIHLARATSVSGQRKQHVILVGPTGGLGHEGQAYLFHVALGGACTPDSNEDGANEGNGTSATATLVESTSTTEASLCVGDTDVFETILLANETLEATLAGPAGAQLRIGTRPADLDDAPVTVSGPVDAAAANPAVVRYTSPRLQQVYVFIKRDQADAIGNYTLSLTTDGMTVDPCMPDPNAVACPTGDADGDGTNNTDDSDDADPCVPSTAAAACGAGDADGDGTNDAADPDSNDACVPNNAVLACGTADADGDGTNNAADPDSNDACVPNNTVLACGTADADGDGVNNAADPNDADPCIPNACASLGTNASVYTRPATIVVTHPLTGGTDWVSIAVVGASATGYVLWSYTDGDNQLSFDAALLNPGTYVVRTHVNDQPEIVAESASFEVR